MGVVRPGARLVMAFVRAAMGVVCATVAIAAERLGRKEGGGGGRTEGADPPIVQARAKALRGIDMKHDPAVPTRVTDGADILRDADFIVGVHQRDEHRVVSERRDHLLRVHDAGDIGFQVRHLESLEFELLRFVRA